jgi:hypothetical protein
LKNLQNLTKVSKFTQNKKLMKRNLFALFLAFLYSFNIFAQDLYIVQNVKGEVKKAGVLLKKGDKVSSTDKLYFGKGAVMLVSSQKVGQMVLSAKEKNATSELAYTINDLMPQSKKASTRSNIILNNALDFQNHFGSNFRVYGDKYHVKVASAYAIDKENRFFFLQMSHSSEKDPFNKQLYGEKENLYFLAKEIFSLNEQPISPKDTKILGLYFYDSKAKEFPKIAAFQLEFVDDKRLWERVEPLAQMLDKSKLDLASYDLFYGMVKDTANELFGECEKDGLEYWLYQKFGIQRPAK